MPAPIIVAIVSALGLTGCVGIRIGPDSDGNTTVDVTPFPPPSEFLPSFSVSRSSTPTRGARPGETRTGTAANDHIEGSPNSDVLDGGAGHDIIHGGDHHGAANVQHDVLRGGDGNDTLIQEYGTATMTGGKGADKFHASVKFWEPAFDGSKQGVTITDFNAAEGDSITIHNANKGNLAGTLADFAKSANLQADLGNLGNLPAQNFLQDNGTLIIQK